MNKLITLTAVIIGTVLMVDLTVGEDADFKSLVLQSPPIPSNENGEGQGDPRQILTQIFHRLFGNDNGARQNLGETLRRIYGNNLGQEQGQRVRRGADEKNEAPEQNLRKLLGRGPGGNGGNNEGGGENPAQRIGRRLGRNGGDNQNSGQTQGQRVRRRADEKDKAAGQDLAQRLGLRLGQAGGDNQSSKPQQGQGNA